MHMALNTLIQTRVQKEVSSIFSPIFSVPIFLQDDSMYFSGKSSDIYYLVNDGK